MDQVPNRIQQAIGHVFLAWMRDKFNQSEILDICMEMESVHGGTSSEETPICPHMKMIDQRIEGRPSPPYFERQEGWALCGWMGWGFAAQKNCVHVEKIWDLFKDWAAEDWMQKTFAEFEQWRDDGLSNNGRGQQGRP